MGQLFTDGCWSRLAECCKHSLTARALRRRCGLLFAVMLADQERLDRFYAPDGRLALPDETRPATADAMSTGSAGDCDCVADTGEDHCVGNLGTALSSNDSTRDDPVVEPADDARSQLDEEGLSLSACIVERISNSLLHTREVTEKATLNVGQHVTELFDIAKRDNEIAGKTLRGLLGETDNQFEEEDGMAAVVAEQRQVIDRFVSETRACFERQASFSNNAVAACREMERSVAAIEKLVFSSEILAFNVQVESIRLGEQGRAFSVLGEEMVRFSSQISQANTAIQKSLDTVSETMKRLQQESQTVDGRLADFSTTLSDRMQGVQDRTDQLTASLNDTLQLITSSNEVLMSHSQSAVSELQFQDPLAQELLRTHHELMKLQRLIATGHCEDDSLADIDPAVGHDGSAHREAGEVELF